MPATVDRTEVRLRLSDGRTLGYAEAGDATGEPVILCHGVPGSRLTAMAEAPAANVGALRLIGIDRPGIGLSDPLPGRRLLDWPSDVVAVADALGLDRFSVLGASGGGPYALACAVRLERRLHRVVLINPMAPLDRPGAFAGYDPLRRFAWWSLRRLPYQPELVGLLQHRVVGRDPEKLVERMASRMSPEDRAVLDDTAVRAALARQLGEAFRQGWGGVAGDLRVLTGPWGFRPEEVRRRVHLWQGDRDRNVPPAMGAYLARALPDCEARFVPGAGHLLRSRQDEVVRVLLDPTPPDGP